VRASIARAADAAGCSETDISVVAAAKNRSPDEIREAIAGGIRVIGENQVQEAMRKKAELKDERVKWHMIGHLQRNKVKKALDLFSTIQSVDSLRLAREISKRSVRAGMTMAVFIEVNIAGDDSKFGIKPEQTAGHLEMIRELPGIDVIGLMTVVPYTSDPESTRPYFREMRRLYDSLDGLTYLSMGMSNDYVQAIEEGANMVRLGTAIFGPRRGE